LQNAKIYKINILAKFIFLCLILLFTKPFAPPQPPAGKHPEPQAADHPLPDHDAKRSSFGHSNAPFSPYQHWLLSACCPLDVRLLSALKADN
jgi:hypothetical protein